MGHGLNLQRALLFGGNAKGKGHRDELGVDGL